MKTTNKELNAAAVELAQIVERMKADSKRASELKGLFKDLLQEREGVMWGAIECLDVTISITKGTSTTTNLKRLKAELGLSDSEFKVEYQESKQTQIVKPILKAV